MVPPGGFRARRTAYTMSDGPASRLKGIHMFDPASRFGTGTSMPVGVL
jgi:hypothetical protein